MESVETKINYKVQSYISQMKLDIQCKIIQLHFTQESEKMNQLMEFILGYDRLELSSDDFVLPATKKTRISKKKEGLTNLVYQCQVHDVKDNVKDKDDANDIVVATDGHEEQEEEEIEKEDVVMELIAQDIAGITFFIDSFGNVYNTEQVLNKLSDPQIVARYHVDAEGKYHIQEFKI